MSQAESYIEEARDGLEEVIKKLEEKEWQSYGGLLSFKQLLLY